MEYIVVLFFQAIIPFAALVVAVIYADKTKKPLKLPEKTVPMVNIPPKNDYNGEISFLTSLKEQGITTIDDALSKFHEKAKSEYVAYNKKMEQHNAEVKALEIQNQKEVVAEEPKKVSQPLDTSLLLIYLGAFIFSFAIFIFSVFSWASFTPIIKIIMILSVPVLFFIAGVYFQKEEKYRPASRIFFTISAISFSIAGIGVWNFGTLAKSFGLSFGTFWIFWGVLTLGLYAFFINYLKLQRFTYLFVVILYTLAFAGATVFTTDIRLQIIFLAVVNAAIAFGVQTYTSNLRALAIVPRIINHVLDLLIMVTVISLLVSGISPAERIVALIGLVVPLLFNAGAFFIFKKKPEGFVLPFLFMVKVVLAMMMYTFSSSMIVVFGPLALFGAILFVELAMVGESKEFRIISPVLLLLFGALLTIPHIDWSQFPGLHIFTFAVPNVISLAIGMITISLAGIFLVIKSKSWDMFGFTLVPVFLLAMSIFGNKSDIIGLLLSFIVLISVGVIIVAINRKEPTSLFVKLPSSFSLIAGLLLAWFVLGQSTLFIGCAYLFLGIAILVIFHLRQEYSAKLLSIIIFVVAFTSLRVFFEREILTEQYRALSYFAYVIPVVLYGLFAGMWSRKGLNNTNSLVGFFIFSFVLIMTSMLFNDALPLALICVVVMLVYLCMTTRSSVFSIIASLLLGWLSIALGNFIGFSNPENFLLFGITMLLQSLFLWGLTKLPSKEGDLHIAVSKQMPISVIGMIAISLFLMWSNSFLGTSESVFTAMGFSVLGIALVLPHFHTTIRKLSGIAFVLSAWSIIGIFSIPAAFYTIVATGYLCILALISFLEGNKQNEVVFAGIAGGLQMWAFLLDSMRGDDVSQIFYGMLLILVAITVTLYGQIRKQQLIVFMGVGFLIFELYIRLQFLIVLIPWWLYLGLIGLACMAGGIYAVSRKKE
jgi:hypothetical protein